MTILELAQLAGLEPKWVAGTGGGEYHSSCPVCGGKDRFYIQPYRHMSKCVGSYCCRQCGIYGDALQFARQFLGYSFKEAAEAVNANIADNFNPKKLYTSNVFYPAKLLNPPAKWIQNATNLVNQAHECLLKNDKFLAYLATRGLPPTAVRRYQLGWIDKDLFLSRTNWGLSEEIGKDGKQRSLWIPKGLLIPSTESNSKVIRLKVRRSNWTSQDKLPKYVAISGSMNGLSLIGSQKNENMVIVESELDAYAIDFAAHDFVCVVAIGSNIKNPDNVIDRLALKAKQLLICHDNDDAGKKMLIKWQRLYPKAKAYISPIGKDIGEAIQKGINVREWLLHAIL